MLQAKNLSSSCQLLPSQDLHLHRREHYELYKLNPSLLLSPSHQNYIIKILFEYPTVWNASEEDSQKFRVLFYVFTL